MNKNKITITLSIIALFFCTNLISMRTRQTRQKNQYTEQEMQDQELKKKSSGVKPKRKRCINGVIMWVTGDYKTRKKNVKELVMQNLKSHTTL